MTVFVLSLPIIATAAESQLHQQEKERLGQQLFFDRALSKNRTQSCATCHAPDRGFIDPRPQPTAAASLGDDGVSVGDRSAPTASYAAYIPAFYKNAAGHYAGGLFWDGRAADLEEQAGGPPLNPSEMGMPDKAAVVARIQEDSGYVQAFQSVWGTDIFSSVDNAYQAMMDALAAFERSEFFAPFDSKYDRFLKGTYQLTEQEELGRTLFFSQQFTNCNLCHQLRTTPNRADETFSNYEYHNIGVPTNQQLRNINGVKSADTGLAQHPALAGDATQAGKFKTPTLRNVAVTAPYMHNGVFKELRTVVLFYNKYNSRSAKRQINPETGEQWAAPEVPENLALEQLKTGPALEDKRVDALVAFLKTLTDQRYEHLLN
jgi:cytochrome c peroxidase